MQLLQVNADQNIAFPVIGALVIVGVFSYLIYRQMRVSRVMNSGISKRAEVIAVEVTSTVIKPDLKVAYITVSYDTETGKRQAKARQGFQKEKMPKVGQIVEIRIDRKDENFVRLKI